METAIKAMSIEVYDKVFNLVVKYSIDCALFNFMAEESDVYMERIFDNL